GLTSPAHRSIIGESVELTPVDDLAAGAGAEGAPGVERDAVTDEAHRAVAQANVDAAAVIAARGEVHLVYAGTADAIAALVIGRYGMGVHGGDEEATVVLQPRVVERAESAGLVALRHRRQVVGVDGRTGGTAIPGAEHDLDHVQIVTVGS